MTPTGHSEIHPGRKIAARRAELNKSLMDIENETEGVIYSKLLYRVENAKKPLETLNVRQLNALLKALEWTPQEFTEATGVEVPGSSIDSRMRLRLEPDWGGGAYKEVGKEKEGEEDFAELMREVLRTTPEELEEAEEDFKALDEYFRYANEEIRSRYEKLKAFVKRVIELGTAGGGG